MTTPSTHPTTPLHDGYQAPRNLDTLFQRPDRISHQLYVVTTVFNSPRFRSRWRLFQDFEKMVRESGAVLFVVEVAFGDRAFAVTRADCPTHVQLRTSHELWLKERAINVGMQHVVRQAPHAKYLAWVDADTRFARDDWADETVHRLQHYAAVQMWSQYQDLTPDHTLIGTAHSFADGYTSGWAGWQKATNGQYYQAKGRRYPGAPGLAWAMRRDAWDGIGGLLDICILGAGDWYMAHGLVGLLNDAVVSTQNAPHYRKAMFDWQTRAKVLHKNLGVVPGLALHFWHGPKAMRRYKTREQILIETQFDPTTDLRFDAGGLFQLNVHDDRTIRLRDLVRQYFHERSEDAI